MPDWWRRANQLGSLWPAAYHRLHAAKPSCPPHAIIKTSSLIVLFLILGEVFRLIRYAQNLPLWSDECLLSVNFIDRGYAGLLGPLTNGQIAPILFLWVQRGVLDLGGFSEWTLRLFPLVCGLASVILFWRLALRVYADDDLARMLAVGIFAVSVHPIRHAAEAKPYATDLAVALILLVLAVQWLRRPRQTGWLWGLCAFLPFGLTCSNPSIFVAGGIGIALMRPIWTSSNQRVRLAFATFGLTLLVSFLVLHCLFGHEQCAKALPGLRRYWASSFPPLRQPWRLPAWLLAAHTGSALAYPGGGARGGSAATFIACLIGVAALLRRGDRAILLCLTAPLGLALVAASWHLYPYGSEARLMQFAAPAICLLSGQGTASLLSRLQRPRLRRGILAVMIVGLVACGVAPQVVSSLQPYRMLYDHQVREFARKFWTEQSADVDIRCAELDYGIGRESGWQGKKAWYLCNQVIYSPGRRPDAVAGGRKVSAGRPLRCVLFGESEESARVRDWLAQMELELDLKEARVYQVPVTLVNGDSATEEWRVFDFVPRRDDEALAVSRQGFEQPQRR